MKATDFLGKAIVCGLGVSVWTMAANAGEPKGVRVQVADLTGIMIEHGFNPLEANPIPADVVAQQGGSVTLFVDDTAPAGGDGLSWASAYQDLQQALADAAADPVVTAVHVAEGIYYPDAGTGDRAAEFLIIGQSNFALLGGFPDGGGDLVSRDPVAFPSVLSGDLNGDDVVMFEMMEIDFPKDGGFPVVLNPDTAGISFSNIDENSFTIVGASGADETVMFDGFTITGGHDLERGGGMIAANAGLTLRNLIFDGNSAGNQGGALFLASATSAIEIQDCTFVHNSAVSEGGGLFSQFGELRAVGFLFLENASERDGGGVYISESDEGQTEFLDGRLERNVSFRSGGGMGGSGFASLFRFHEVVFYGNTSRSDGGGLFLGSGSYSNWSNEALITSCVFDSNKSSSSGGGMRSIRGHVLRDCEFVNNKSSHGGGLAPLRDIKVYDSNFMNNMASGAGGGVRVDSSGGSILFQDCLFQMNSAHRYGGGRFARARLLRCVFIENEAESIGGLSLNSVDGFSQLISCIVMSNSATNGDVGGVQLMGQGILLVSESLIVGNSSTGRGGGIQSSGSNTRVVNSTIVGNYAPELGGIDGASPVTIENSILWGNTDDISSPERAQLGGAFHNVSNSVIEGLSDFFGSGNIGGDPMFLDSLGPDSIPNTGDEDYRLSADSPAIDAGDDSLVANDWLDLDEDGDTAEPVPFDLDGNARFIDGGSGLATVDIGAYEWQGAMDCPADFTGDGVLNFFDVSAFLQAFGNNDPAADFTDDGILNFFDVSIFLQAFAMGCP